MDELEKRIGFSFKNKKILKEALTHRSYINENPNWDVPHNERLEFLGDAVLELVVSNDLFSRFPDYPEGQLTSIRAALVNYQIIARVAKGINLENFIWLSKGEAKDVGRAREVILANGFEALIGAVYLDAGYNATKRIIDEIVISPNLDEILELGLYKDPKSRLQEVIQENLKITPVYQIIEEWGPDHKKIFKSGVYFDKELIAEGEGYSKQEAEVEAARNALEKNARYVS